MKRQPAPTKGDIRSPTRLIFQQNPPNPVRSICIAVFGSRGFRLSNIYNVVFIVVINNNNNHDKG
ncbi:MAG: hypothetical protein ACI8RD_001556 [Bacillariaceae sp.]|jgi:hypothetical protein